MVIIIVKLMGKIFLKFYYKKLKIKVKIKKPPPPLWEESGERKEREVWVTESKV